MMFGLDNDATYQIDYLDKAAWNVIGPAIHTYNIQQAGDDPGQNLCFVLRAPDGEIVGGVIGATHWDWLHIDLMWVKEELRGCGHGHRLLALAEQEAWQRGAKNAYLDTFNFRARLSTSNRAIVFLVHCPISRPATNATS